MAGRSGRVLCDEQEELNYGLPSKLALGQDRGLPPTPALGLNHELPSKLALGQDRELPPTPALRVAYRRHP